MSTVRQRSRISAFERSLARDGVDVIWRRTVGGEVVEQTFSALVTEITSDDVDEDERRAYQRLGTIDMLISALDTDGEPVQLKVPGSVEINSERWQVIRPVGRDHGPEAVTESWRIGLGTPIKLGPVTK